MLAATQTIQDHNYTNYYQRQQVAKVYPTEFVLRGLLGNYPNHKGNKAEYAGKRVLDLGFGDGRNMPLLYDLGMEVHGVEVSPEICQTITGRMAAQGVKIQAQAGRNSRIPYGDQSFDHILACNSCYYIDEGQRYADNLAEIARTLKPGGLFIHSLPMPTTFLLDGAVDEGEQHMRVTQDPYGVRVGALIKTFTSVEAIEAALAPWFTDIKVGSLRDDYWGSAVHLWLVVCRRKSV